MIWIYVSIRLLCDDAVLVQLDFESLNNESDNDGVDFNADNTAYGAELVYRFLIRQTPELILFIMQHPTTASPQTDIKMSQVLPSPHSDRPPEDTKNKVRKTSNWPTALVKC